MKGTMDFLVVVGRHSKAGIMRLRRTFYNQVIIRILFIWLSIFLGGCSLSFQKERSPALKDSAGKLNILLIGNSYTFFNQFPELLEDLAREGGHTIHITTLAFGGWTLNDHAQSQKTLETIRGEKWDYVVLQEQSVIPSDPAAREQQMYPAVRTLNTEIERTGANTILLT